MEWNLMFFLNSVLLGVGLAMDAFSVSMANGLSEPGMKRRRMCGIAGVFAGFQALMPILGWVFVHTAVQYFSVFEKYIPWIALILLGFIGGKMLIEGIKNIKACPAADPDGQEKTSNMGGAVAKITVGTLLIQGIATSIDALSVGFTISEYDWLMAVVSALIIAAVTFIICMAGLVIGKKFGTKLSNKAQIFGGIILIAIGIEIFVSGVL